MECLYVPGIVDTDEKQQKNKHDSLSLLYQGNRSLTCSSNAVSHGKEESHPEITTK